MCGKASPEWSVDREAIKVSIRHKIPNISLCFKFTKIFHLELIFMWKFCRINLKISSTNFHYLRNLFKFSWASSQKFPPFSLFFSSWDKFPPSTYSLDCRFLDVGLLLCWYIGLLINTGLQIYWSTDILVYIYWYTDLLIYILLIYCSTDLLVYWPISTGLLIYWSTN